MTRPPERGEESGFTIVELLIAIVVEALIIGALASAFIVSVNGTDTVKSSLAQSSDARLIAAHLAKDARNSSGPETSLSDITSCPNPSSTVTGTPVAIVRFNWSSTTLAGATSARVANYLRISNNLVRRYCEAGALVSEDTLATEVASATAACSPTANCSGTPTKVTLSVTESAAAGATAYQFDVSAAYRKASASQVVTPLGGDLILMGGHACGSGGSALDISGNARAYVTGTAYLNTPDVGSCKSLRFANSGAIVAGSTAIVTGGTCTASGASVCPTTSSYSPALPDPYAYLTAPSGAGLPTISSNVCPGGVAIPGIYTVEFKIDGIIDCTLTTGTYIFQAGFTISNGGSVHSGPGGVLLYLSGGAFSLSGAGTMDVTAQATGAYADVVIWQAAANTNTMNISNGGYLTMAGALYAPGAQVNISGAGQNPCADAIVAQRLVLTNSGLINVGSCGGSSVLTITSPATLGPATAGIAMTSTTITGSGGSGLYQWSATGLPAGVTISAATGVISGTPAAAGSYNVTVTLNDTAGHTPDTQGYTFTVVAPLSITSATLPGGTQNSAYSTTLVASNGTAPYSWSSTALPAGLSLNAGTGVLAGTPTATGTSSITFTVTDSAGATTQRTLSITIAAPAVAPTITSVALTNGGSIAGQVEKSDTVTVTFSGQLNVSSLCSTWSGDSSNQTLNTGGDVVVSIADGTGATNDVLTVTSGTCTFNFGSINLGSNAYLSGGGATFSGSGGSKSSITWNATTYALTITLGTKAGAGTVATVASSTAVYSASASITNPTGQAVTNSPFSSAAGQRF